ncbi:hypothetical protein CVD25_22205 [Bacillus canaveralius]|uniref:Uncharacterized protein n=1 Tax=Bacillus canaveralius TaxID=1403243 RepID=A0A2N5GP78_9BACI|nr:MULTISPECIES: DUF2161 family putative PD-(D/E)XK-type phosphodiesterase [Bacillus]PLR84378.1 hypothetical protein CU635_06355 [Bacillus canaveralius]PLR87040.1 hypothetical protein CVD23_05280 [Bacillus sp. V33-4]PLR88812.1 hypothetical protein CVD25_22205 [Bacillus canaveralius]RSK57908.1 hypothetical protein EJA13_00650 [Bacillus canaveralius]
MPSKKDKIFEMDLYKPVQKYFTQQGYEVYGEVNHCDLAAVKGEDLIVVEMKLRLNVELLIQATKRQRFADSVYIAIPKPKQSLFSKKWRDICHLIRRLELGLILVSFQRNNVKLDIPFSPASFDRLKSMKLNKKRRANILTEIKGRNGDYNVGGSNKTKIMTAYKENCIHIATCLDCFGPLSPKSLREMGTGDKTLSILNKNYYGWFDKIKRGTYTISNIGKSEIQEYPEVADYYYKLKRDEGQI